MLIFSALFAILGTAAAQEDAGPLLPTFVSLTPNIHDYTRFADGGDDSNWYVGFNNAWIVKLPAAPMGEYSRAMIGAKVGRAKSRPVKNKPWLRELIDGKIYMGISQTPGWSAEQSFFLVETADMPREADPAAQIDGVGGGEWFWAEVPLTMISFSQPNYLIIYSPTKFFVKSSSSPILGAAPVEEPTKEPRAWNNRSISGVPPRAAVNSLETPINTISPALAIKLVPTAQAEVAVSEFKSVPSGKKRVVSFSVGGENVVETWVEMSRDQLDWERISRLQRRPPFMFTLGPDVYPAPGAWLRGAARDLGGNIGHSNAFQVPYNP